MQRKGDKIGQGLQGNGELKPLFCHPIQSPAKRSADFSEQGVEGDTDQNHLSVSEELYNWRGSDLLWKSDLRSLLKIPDDHEVLFLQGDATTQFVAIPLNLFFSEDTTKFIVTGSSSGFEFTWNAGVCLPDHIFS